MWYQQRGAVVQWNDRGTQMFGTVISSNSNGFCTIRPQNSRNTLDLLGRSLQPVQPRASDKKVLIISGVYAGLFADLESMEGASIFQVCQGVNGPCLQIRSISNKVEKRNKKKWDIPIAINNLNQTVSEIITSL